jgi:cytochrome P450
MLDEIDTVLGDRTPTAADVMKLPYTRQVFQEAIRMYAPVPLMPRQALEDDEMNGYHIPAKSYVVMYFDGVHHNANAWDDPDTFDPDRFSPERRSQQHPYAYLAFSGGPRKCAGEEFAYTEAVITLARMFQRYRIEMAPGQDIEPHFAITMHTGPVMMQIAHR